MYSAVSTNSKNVNGMTILTYCASCYDFRIGNHQNMRIVDLVPNAIRREEDSEVISWKCNRGDSCESECVYAKASGKRD
jgi:hypothetical protein